MPCHLCESLPDELEASYEVGAPEETLPPAAYELTCANSALWGLGIRQCPGCGDYFVHRSHVPGGSEDYARSWHVETLRRASVADVLTVVRVAIRSASRSGAGGLESLRDVEAELAALVRKR